MVEFALTLLLWFIVFVLVIDMAIAMYDKGAVTNAAQYAARQGSLYWVDPSNYADTTPIENKRLKESMITTAVNYWNGTVIAPAGNSIAATILVSGPFVDDSSWGPGYVGVADASVDVTISYPHSFLGLTKLLGVAGWSLSSQSALNTEARL